MVYQVSDLLSLSREVAIGFIVSKHLEEYETAVDEDLQCRIVEFKKMGNIILDGDKVL